MTGVRGKGRVAGAQRAALARALYPRALRPFLLSHTRTPLHPIPPSFPAGWLPLPFLNTRSVTVNHPAEGSAWEGSGPLKGFAKPAPQLRRVCCHPWSWPPCSLVLVPAGLRRCLSPKGPGTGTQVRGLRHSEPPPSVGREWGEPLAYLLSSQGLERI